MLACGGNGAYPAAAGTVYRQTGAQAAGAGTVTIDNGGLLAAAGCYTDSALTPVNYGQFTAVIVSNRGNLAVTSNDTFSFTSGNLVTQNRDTSKITLLSTNGVTFPSPFIVGAYTLELGTASFNGDVTVSAPGRLSPRKGYPMALTVNGNLTVASGGELSGRGCGYPTSQGPGAGDPRS